MTSEVISLDLEKNQIIEYKNRFNEFKHKIKHESLTKQHLKPFYLFIEELTDIFNDTLEERWGQISLLGTDNKIAARKIDDLKNLLRQLYFNLDYQIRDLGSIPRNLYRFIDYYLERMNVSLKYSIEIGDCLAIKPFNDILKILRANRDYPALFKKMGETNDPFFSIQIPPEFKNEKNAFMWPLVMHEVSHAIDQKNNFVNKYFDKNVPWWYCDITAAAAMGDEDCRNKLKIMELFSDFLSTWLIGPYYPNIVLNKFYSSASLLEENISHPSIDRRINDLVYILNENNFKKHVKLLEEKIKTIISPDEREEGDSQIRTDLIKIIDRNFKSCKYNFTKYENSMKSWYPTMSENDLIDQFLNKKPVLLGPSSLLTLISLINEDKIEEIHNILFSDFMKLYFIKREFKGKIHDSS